ncbi:MAG: chitobiase/beta-hexosaminidase C-terminal domain-containing protein [Bacteroidales bacterium]|nr:chitobiase/beta-hexosaminidase C-terminal domain-containing protein [Bacteroidales bacterium]
MDHLKGFTTNGKSNKRGGLKGLLVRGGALVLMLWAALPAMGQSYVFLYKNGNTVYFLYNNNRAVGRTETFNTSTCIFTGTGTSSSTFYNGDRYLQRNTNTLRFYTTSTTWTITTYGRVQNSNRYIRYYNNGWTSLNNTNGGDPGTSTDYTVLFTYSNPTLITITSITGDEVLTTTGSHNYSATGKAIQFHQFDGYSGTTPTSYYWYSDALQTELPTPTSSDGVSYSWSLNANGANASVNSSNGTITVNALPASDVAMTLTCTASKNGESATTTKTVYLLAENPSAPVISLYGSSQAQITCPSPNVTIYYTTDGNTPTNGDTEYSDPFAIDCPTTTVKAIAVRNGHSSTVANTTLTCKVPTPVITMDGANATIALGAGSPNGTALYYTTDGTTPSDASTPYNGSPVTLTNTQTIKVIAVKSGYTNSDIASADYIVEGVNGGYVVLDDREEHSWSYYSDTRLPQMMRSLNPADVKITYNGNGTGTVQTNNSDTPETWGADASGVKVGIDANASTFIYYKTLERTDGSSSDNPTGRCSYTTIPNPFSVRPTYDSDGTSKYRGFYAWRVKSLSGGTIHSAASGGTSYGVGSTINAETEIFFAPSNEYGMEVEFEALWARAYVSTTGVPNYSLGVERNFYVITASANSNITAGNNPCTYTSIYPNGTTNGTSAASSVTVYKYGTFSASADSKIEYIILRNNNSTISAAGNNFTIGRGVTGYNSGVCATTFNGLSGTKTSNFKLRIESGTYTDFYFMGTSSMTSGLLTATLGCDYDRANNKDNTKLRITHDICASNGGTIGADGSIGTEIFKCTVKSGNFDLGVYGGAYQFYISSPGGNAWGKRTLIIEGGYFSDIAGGIDRNGQNNLANINATLVDIRIKGGESVGAVFGAAQRSASYGDRRIVITGGTFSGWIAGGANGTDNSGGQMGGASYVYVGGTARVDSDSSTSLINRAVGGNVFAAGCGFGDGTSSGQVKVGTNIAIADDAYIERGVYGGGSFGYTTTYSNIYLMGGTVDCIGGGVTSAGTGYSNTVKGGIYGGACQNDAGQTNVYVYGGSVNGGVYGGGNVSGDVAGPINVDVYGTDPQPGSGYAINQVFGGGNAANYSGTPVVTVHDDNGCDISIGELYGGGNAATVTGTNVTVSGGNRIGNVYGGCYGADVTTNGTKVNIKGGTIEHVYGGNNYRGTITGAIRVRAHKDSDCPMKIGELYGGGNRAGSAAGSIDIGCTGTYVEGVGGHADCNETDNRIGYELEGIHEVYGGANQANITGDISLTIDSGMVYRVFGGNNNSGSISGTITVNIQKTNPNTCGWYVGYVYGGGFNAPYSKEGTANNPSVNVSAGLVSHSVFGGGKGDDADITGNPRVTLSGTAQVGENVYGGGDAADVIGNTSVILKD